MDFVYYGTGVAGATIFVSSVVGAAAGVNLYSDVKIGDTVISTSKVFAIFRVIVLIVLLTFNISWATLGTSTTIDNYLLYRRAGYIFSLCVVVFVTVPLLVYFSNNVLRLMMGASRAERGTGELARTTIKETNYASNFASEIEIVPNSHPPSAIDVRSPSTKSKVPRISIKPLKTAKRATIAEKIANFRFAINTALKKIMANPPNYLLDICDYRANYLGCGSLINQFALIDLIMILLATGTTALYIAKIIQNVMTKVWSKHEGKKWSPLDTTLVLCFSSNIFRIIQLANARSLSYRNISQMSDEDIIRYVQINIIMDFVYYSMGVFGSTVFVSSVVGAAAGVNLYSDVKIGQTVIPTNKVFAVLRVIILVLLLTFNILWATLGTTTSRDTVIDILRNSSASDKGTKSSLKASKSAPNNTFQMDEADFPVSVMEDTPPVKIENPKLSVKTIFNFRFAINTTIWLLYFLTACNLVLLIVGGEVSYFLQNPTALLYFKGLSDFSVWISCSFMLLYLYIC
ncbi:hypothetical protein HDV04_005133 [Boothiomyces sp. JEL0838]|nr:hypothetical protein HDV04_005133 [Boothiomyces sp. JEL0838]